jgi:hypothetical protein
MERRTRTRTTGKDEGTSGWPLPVRGDKVGGGLGEDEREDGGEGTKANEREEWRGGDERRRMGRMRTKGKDEGEGSGRD